MTMYPIRILSTGRYVPERIVRSEAIDKELKLEPGTAEKITGVQTRHYAAAGEKASDMAAAAIRDALSRAELEIGDIDLILGASGTPQQPIPCNAALTQEALGKDAAGIPSIDVSATCMSFVIALDVAGAFLLSGRFKRIVIFSSDVASQGINPRQTESYALFGDAAAAMIVERAPADSASRVLGTAFETYAEGAHHTEIRGGGSALPGHKYNEDLFDDFHFDMKGPRIFRVATRVTPPLVHGLLKSLELNVHEMDVVVPHQASKMGLALMCRRLEIPEEKYIYTLPKYGNTIASSVPLAFDEGVREGRIKRGDRVMMVGTAAGFLAAAAVLVY